MLYGGANPAVHPTEGGTDAISLSLRADPRRQDHRRCSVSAGACAVIRDIRSSARKDEADADAEFLTKVVPSIAASVKIIEYEVKNTSDEKVREFAGRVLKQQPRIPQNRQRARQAAQYCGRYRRRQGQQGDDRQTIQAQGSDLDVAFLEWLSNIHHDATVFENEVKNGTDPELKTYAKNSITAGNEHLKEARELLAKLKK